MSCSQSTEASLGRLVAKAAAEHYYLCLIYSPKLTASPTNLNLSVYSNIFETWGGGQYVKKC